MSKVINSSKGGMSRRVFVKGLGYVSMGMVFSTMLGGCEQLIRQIQNRPIRRRLRNGSTEVNNAIAIYKDAVSQMQALPSSNPRSWAAQAALHGTVNGGFNFCQHGTNHFFSWHRAYLFYFEKICQALTGEDSFGLPYWNWNQNPTMHAEFTNAGSVLSHPRNNTSVAGNSAFSNNTMNTIFGDSNFFSFGSQLEGSPHNMAHSIIGQDMVTGGSPRDPVFWVHHCMVDYAWAKWNIELENNNTNDPAWNNTSWSHFVDGDGNSVASITAGSTVLMPLLSYRYETSAVGGFAAGMSLASRSNNELMEIEQRLRDGADIQFEVKQRVPISRRANLSLDRTFSAETRVSSADFNALVESDERSEKVFVQVNYNELPPNNDFFVRVFINLPGANRRTSTDDAHYAGSFAFFGTRGDHGDGHHHKTDFLVNATDTLKRLRRQGQLQSGESLSVQLVAVPAGERFIKADVDLEVRDIEFIVSPVVLKSR